MQPSKLIKPGAAPAPPKPEPKPRPCPPAAKPPTQDPLALLQDERVTIVQRNGAIITGRLVRVLRAFIGKAPLGSNPRPFNALS